MIALISEKLDNNGQQNLSMYINKVKIASKELYVKG